MLGREKRAKREKILEATTRLLSLPLADLGNDPDAIDPDSLDLYRQRVKIAELQLSIVRALHAEARLARPVVVALRANAGAPAIIVRASSHPRLPLSHEQPKYLQTCLLCQRREGANRLCHFHISNIMEISPEVNLISPVVHEQLATRHSYIDQRLNFFDSSNLPWASRESARQLEALLKTVSNSSGSIGSLTDA